MKKHFFLMPLLAALAMTTACSNDDDLLLDEPTATGSSEPSGNYGYVAVNIIQGDNSRSRADETGFVYGTDAENEAKNATFYVFDDNASDPTIIGSPYVHSLTKDETVPGKTAGGNIERKYQVVLVIDGVSSTMMGNPKYIVCLLNAPEFSGIAHLSDLKAKVADYCTNNQTAGKFVMSNAVYVNSTSTVVGTEIAAANIAKSEAEAKANAVQIHVERVVAKVNLTKTSTAEFSTTSTNIKLNGTSDVTLTPHITGIELANIAQESYLLKSVDNQDNWGITDFGDWWKNDATNFRSYWESMPGKATTAAGEFYANRNYNDIVTYSYTEGTTTSTDVLDKLGNYNMYIQPNTNQKQKTAVLVTAELRKSGEDTPTSFVYLRGGYYEPTEAMKAIASYVQQWGYYYKEDEASVTTYKRLTPEFFTWTDIHDTPALDWLKSYEVVAHLSEKTPAATEGDRKAYSIYKWNEASQSMVKVNNGIQKINNKLQGTSASDKSKYTALYYNGGKCYYFVNIDQTPVANLHKTASTSTYADGTYEGVVRNHYYKLTLNGIKGLGTPVFDPNDKIIPEKVVEEEELSYLAATVEVLSWKFVNQNVTFGE